MKYWIIIDSVQEGPLTLEEVASKPELNPSTPVWHEGLSDWTTASAIPEIAAILSSNNENQGDSHTYSGQQDYTRQSNPYSAYNSSQHHYGQPYGQNPYGQQPNDPNAVPPMPDNYLIWAILATICCCIPSGIVAIFYAAKVSPAYYSGDYIAALDASSKAQLWVIISFVAGLIWAPFSVIFGALF